MPVLGTNDEDLSCSLFHGVQASGEYLIRDTISGFALLLAMTALRRPIPVNSYDAVSVARTVSEHAFVAEYFVSTRILTCFPFTLASS